MRKLSTKFNLTQIYQKYNRLVTVEGEKQFIRVIYILSICAVAIIFIWYYGIASLNAKNPNLLSPIETSQREELPSSGNSKFAEDIKDSVDSALPNKNEEIISPDNHQVKDITDDKQQVKDITDKNLEVKKTSEPKTAIKKDQPAKSDYGLVKKTIYIGANTSQVALTFDDGYNKKTIEKVLDILESNNVKSTFFIIGKVLNDYPEIWKRAINEGHQICNHTNHHKVLTNMSDDLVEAEILGWETSAQKVFGEDYIVRMKKEFPYLRLPGGGGAKSDRILSIAQRNGYTVIGWNLETFSSVINPLKKTHSVEEISNKIEQHIVTRCSNGSIILLHFNEYDTGNIEEIVLGIKSRGFDIQLISKITAKNK